MFVDQVWPACEENYPSMETINMQCTWAEKLAWDRTAHMTDFGLGFGQRAFGPLA